MDRLKSFFGGGKPEGGAIKKQSTADKQLLVILGLIVIILWVADRRRYDASIGFMEQYPAPVFIGAALVIALMVYMLQDPNKKEGGMPVPLKNLILILQVLAVCILLAGVANSSFRMWVLQGGEWVQYGIVLILSFALISFVFTPKKNKSWTDTLTKLSVSGFCSAAIGAVTYYVAGPEVAILSILGGTGGVWKLLNWVGY